MEATIGGQNHQLHTAEPSHGYGKRSLEWNPNEWKWDGHDFVAIRLNAEPLDCRNKQSVLGLAPGGILNSSSSCSEEADFGITGKGKGELKKRRRVLVVEDNEPCDEAASLTLKLGGNSYTTDEADLLNWEGKNGKRSVPQGGNSSRSCCQVEGCGVDLSEAKDYHRRHKVCEMHAKASRAMVGNVIQRFCQQCSRFHLLEEFDEGKRSCRRRLAGHNRRRRKTHPDPTVSGSSLTDDQANSYLLITLLKILSNLHRNFGDRSDQPKDQDLLSHLLGNIARLAGSSDASNLSGLPQASQGQQAPGTSAGTPSEATDALLPHIIGAKESSMPLCLPSKTTCISDNQGPGRSIDHHPLSGAVATVAMPSENSILEVSAVPSQISATKVPVEDVLPIESTIVRLKDFDLNRTYVDPQDCEGGFERSTTVATLGTGSPNCDSQMLQDSHQLSPPQTSGNTDSTSPHSLSSSNGDAQSRTGRIVFKLFGKDPQDFPLVLRAQILDWLSHSPTDMESYIRPGCIILTIYLRLAESMWEQLTLDLRSSLNRLLLTSDDDFWRRGWMYASVQDRMAFIYNGHVVLDTSLLLRCANHCKILSVTPVAVAMSTRVNFIVKGFNLARSTARVLCEFDGMSLVQEVTQPLVVGTYTRGDEESQCFSFSCALPDATGRGFIEVEDHGLSSSFFPFIVAEEDVCLEIRMLENSINMVSYDELLREQLEPMHARNQAMNFLNEMGWLLRRSHLRCRSDQLSSFPDVFSLQRFRSLMTFAIDHEWCAVVKKLLDILFQGNIDLGGVSPCQLILSEDLLHRAVQKNCKSMVKLLLIYKPDTASKETGLDSFVFRPDMLGPSNITPLHIAAAISGAESVLDALTDDPGQFGIKAWDSIHDSVGFTPEDYARSGGHDSYILLVQKKINKISDKGHVALDIPSSLQAPDVTLKRPAATNSSKPLGFQIEQIKLRPTHQQSCKLCDRRLAHSSSASRSLLYRPVMLSLVGIAAVCVCVSLLFKGPPNVLSARRPFTWESLPFGSI